MDKSINFLSAQTGRRIAVSNRLRQTIKVFLWVVGVELIISLVFIGWQLVVKNQTGRLEKLNKQAEIQIDDYRDLESMIYVVGTRVRMIKPLFVSERKKISSVLELTNKLSNYGILPKDGFKIGSDGSFQVEGVAESVSDLEEIKTVMDELKNQGYFYNYKVDSLSRVQSGQYRLTILLYLVDTSL